MSVGSQIRIKRVKKEKQKWWDSNSGPFRKAPSAGQRIDTHCTTARRRPSTHPAHLPLWSANFPPARPANWSGTVWRKIPRKRTCETRRGAKVKYLQSHRAIVSTAIIRRNPVITSGRPRRTCRPPLKDPENSFCFCSFYAHHWNDRKGRYW